MTDELLENIDDGVALVTLNRPDVLNALNPPLMKALHETLLRLSTDNNVRCVVLTGAGRGFCSGGDIKQRAKAEAHKISNPDSDSEPIITDYARSSPLRRSMEAARLLHDMDKPTIAMINGACAGAGIGLAGACDIRIAGKSAVFTSAFRRVGLSGDYGGSWFWTKILGTAKARELYLLSEKMTADEALAFGMVHRVYPDEELRDRTLGLAKSLAEGMAWTYTFIKRNLNLAEEGTLEQVFDLEALHMTLAGNALAKLALRNKASAK